MLVNSTHDAAFQPLSKGTATIAKVNQYLIICYSVTIEVVVIRVTIASIITVEVVVVTITIVVKLIVIAKTSTVIEAVIVCHSVTIKPITVRVIGTSGDATVIRRSRITPRVNVVLV